MIKPELIILLVILILHIESFEVTQESKEENTSSEFFRKPLKEEPIIKRKDEFVHCNQNIIQYGIVKKIQYFPCSRDSNTCSINLNPSSACIRCEICLSIVDQINQTLTFVYDQICPSNSINETKIDTLMKMICNDSFTHYRLRISGGQRIIFDRIPNSNLVDTNVDGNWEQHMKKRCHDLIDGLGSVKLYNHWKSWWDDKTKNINKLPKLDELLCNDESTFLRDCKRITRGSRQHVKGIGNERLKKKLAEFFETI